jgi:hypothetical protein
MPTRDLDSTFSRIEKFEWNTSIEGSKLFDLKSASSDRIVSPSAVEEEEGNIAVSDQTSSSSKLSAEDSEVFDLSSTNEKERDITVKSNGVDSEVVDSIS